MQLNKEQTEPKIRKLKAQSDTKYFLNKGE